MRTSSLLHMHSLLSLQWNFTLLSLFWCQLAKENLILILFTTHPSTCILWTHSAHPSSLSSSLLFFECCSYSHSFIVSVYSFLNLLPKSYIIFLHYILSLFTQHLLLLILIFSLYCSCMWDKFSVIFLVCMIYLFQLCIKLVNLLFIF